MTEFLNTATSDLAQSRSGATPPPSKKARTASPHVSLRKEDTLSTFLLS